MFDCVDATNAGVPKLQRFQGLRSDGHGGGNIVRVQDCMSVLEFGFHCEISIGIGKMKSVMQKVRL